MQHQVIAELDFQLINDYGDKFATEEQAKDEIRLFLADVEDGDDIEFRIVQLTGDSGWPVVWFGGDVYAMQNMLNLYNG
jgi:hypothetical protein